MRRTLIDRRKLSILSLPLPPTFRCVRKKKHLQSSICALKLANERGGRSGVLNRKMKRFSEEEYFLNCIAMSLKKIK